MKSKIEQILNLFPEVTWDRWAGELDSENPIGIFGWLPRDESKSDFVWMLIDKGGAMIFSTSSAEKSAEFSGRLGFKNHTPCKRVEHTFNNVKAIHLNQASSELLDDSRSKALAFDVLIKHIASTIPPEAAIKQMAGTSLVQALLGYVFVPKAEWESVWFACGAAMGMLKEIKPEVGGYIGDAVEWCCENCGAKQSAADFNQGAPMNHEDYCWTGKIERTLTINPFPLSGGAYHCLTDRLGKAAYDAYCGDRAWKSFNGDPLPQWGQVKDDIKEAWKKAASEVIAAAYEPKPEMQASAPI